MSKNGTVTITIDNRVYNVETGITILEAARRNDIYIPTLCWHPDLSAHGGCRMCIVEVEGLRNLPTACTTPVSEGMRIRTHTQQVQDARREILQLFMSEHPSSCLICDEAKECSQVLSTIRKAGVTTGCRYCPSDQQCELQEVAAYLGVDQLEYPIYYRNIRVEREDPFYDRDYNLCILCGRCVRVCQEVRLANVLAFTQRGRNSVIGPAFGRTHLQAGCEFCGACVEVCPVGALREKTRAWEGTPDREQQTTCSFCGVGCQVRMLVRDDRIIGALPADDPEVNKGQLCVKGRFCVTELVTGHERLCQPYQVYTNKIKAEISWDDAVAQAAGKLQACEPDEFAMLVSPNCLNEDLYVAQKFVRTVMKSHRIDSSPRLYYGPGFNAYLELFKRSVPLKSVVKADAVVCVGLDARFGRSVVGVEIRRALKRGAKLITVNPRQHAMTLNAHQWLHPEPGKESKTIEALLKAVRKSSGGKNSDQGIDAAAEILKSAKHPVIMLGSEFLQLDESTKILQVVADLAATINAGILPLPAQNNFLGSVLTGVYPELLPGGKGVHESAATGKIGRLWKSQLPRSNGDWNATALPGGKRLKVLYLVGEVPPSETPRADFVIWQNIYPPRSESDADLVLPSAAFTESNGTFINGEGRLQRVRRAVEPIGRSLPDWKILSRIARAMGSKAFPYRSSGEIHREMAKLIPGFGKFEKPARKPQALDITGRLHVGKAKTHRAEAADKKLPYLLSASMVEHTYKGFPLAAWVEGSQQLLTEGVIDLNPEDASRLKVSNGEVVVVNSPHFSLTRPVRVDTNQPRGTLHVTLRHGERISPNPHPVKIRKKR